MSENMSCVLNIERLTKHYKGFTLGPLDYQVEKGTSIALVGANGSGKSTLFRLLVSILQADDGTIMLFGQNIKENEAKLKQKVGYTGNLLEPFSNLTIKELSSLVSYWYPSWDHARYAQFLTRYNIDESAKYGKCSTGTKKKIEFILSLSHNPDLLLLDEPSAGVDISTQRKIKEDLMDFMENGEKSIVLATHIVDEIKHICDYITVLQEGKIIHTVNKDDIYEKWARLWVTSIPDQLKKHPHVVSISEAPLQVVTNNLHAMEDEFINEGVTITHRQRLTIEEVIDYFID